MVLSCSFLRRGETALRPDALLSSDCHGWDHRWHCSRDVGPPWDPPNYTSPLGPYWETTPDSLLDLLWILKFTFWTDSLLCLFLCFSIQDYSFNEDTWVAKTEVEGRQGLEPLHLLLLLFSHSFVSLFNSQLMHLYHYFFGEKYNTLVNRTSDVCIWPWWYGLRARVGK